MSKLLIITKDVPLGPAQVLPDEILEQEFMIPRGLNQTQLTGRMRVDLGRGE